MPKPTGNGHASDRSLLQRLRRGKESAIELTGSPRRRLARLVSPTRERGSASLARASG
jgi:hypothetical protein